MSSTIIFDCNFKFLFDFWTTLFKLLDTNLLFNLTYHFQTNNLSKRINQIFQIALRYFITKHLTLNEINVLFTLQLIFNNLFNTFIEKISNEIVYEFKVRKIIHAITIFFLSKNINVDAKRQSTNIKATRFRYRIKTTNVIFYVNVQSKIQYDFKHVLLLFRFDDKILFRLHYNYTLLDKSNHKLSKQRCYSFKMKRRVDRLTYELNFSFRWKICRKVYRINFSDDYTRLDAWH